MTNTAAAQSVSLTANLAHQLEQAHELRKLAYEVIVAEGLRDLTMAQRIALTMFYRSLQTHEASEILVKQKLIEDARVLVRVLVENEVNCAYMLLVGDEETATDFVKYPRYRNYGLMRNLKSVDESRFREQVSVELEDETRKEYEALHPRFKDRRGEWCVDGYSGACRSHIPRSNRSSVPRQTDHAFRGMPISRSEVKPIRNLRLSE